ncbi:hypothetical protein C4D60_Mb06t28770 [Musa balbisiana]|uniref:Importin N-terminal domain-containing protein n=1 Tax=Musa balbisiana TaxID=52838 RepID=A0A4S8IRC9_MUSBA|nr:hypothetical protein C4D60_Mb06t28770 [Musa balbisiana]
MDLAGLVVVLRSALSHTCEERKAAEESLNQLQYTPQHLVRILQIIIDGSCDMAVRQVASIHFKNVVAKHWSPHELGKPWKLPESDKRMVRDNIIEFIAQVPSLLRFKSNNEQTPFYLIVEETFPLLLNIFNKLVRIVNPSIEVADLIKFICKIFWSSINLDIPHQLLNPKLFSPWMALFLNLLERPVPLEGQPSDPHLRQSWGWWKVKKWTIHILNHYIEDPYSPRIAAVNFLIKLVSEDEKTNLQKFIRFIAEIFRRYNEAPIEYKQYGQKDGALLAIGALCNNLKQSEPYKSEIELIIVWNRKEKKQKANRYDARKVSKMLDVLVKAQHNPDQALA